MGKRGEITAFLSLIFVLLISFITAILESTYLASIAENFWKNMRFWQLMEAMARILMKRNI